MEWITPNQVQKAFQSLFVQNTDTITLNDDCLVNLGEILQNLVTENYPVYTFRRAIGLGQNVQKGLLPLLIHVRDDVKDIDKSTRILDAAIKILVNLTIPVEYLLSVESFCDEDGQNIVQELNKLLTSIKEVFMDSRSTKAVVDHIKFVVETDSQLDLEQCESINNCLLLLGNVLHIPETKTPAPSGSMVPSSMQNKIIWNLFTQSIDKLIIYLMACPQKIYWGMSIVQLIALMYKDQHMGTLQKLLNLWLEASYSDSSDDNESNTSPPDQGSGDDSSPVITSDPTSDSSDNGGNDRGQHGQLGGHTAAANCKETASSPERTKNASADAVRGGKTRGKSSIMTKRKGSAETENYSSSSGISSMGQSTESNGIPVSSEEAEQQNKEQQPAQVSSPPACLSSVSSSAPSVGAYPATSPVAPKNRFVCRLRARFPTVDMEHKLRTRSLSRPLVTTTTNLIKARSPETAHVPKDQIQQWQRQSHHRAGEERIAQKKLVKRSKSHIIIMKGLLHHLPTDEDISNILKEFTVDFLLKGYGNLVDSLYTDFLNNVHVQLDTSHFFWLVTYFLKFAIQLEVDLERINPVLSYEVLSYLIFQGVWVYEELEICCSIPDMDLKPCLRRLHLVVTAIREFLQGVETYKKMIHLSDGEREDVLKLQGRIEKMEDLRMLFVLLLRQYNPHVQSRQYLQDLILTNHHFLMFLDNSCKTSNFTFNMVEHLKLFATVEIMRQYGLLLENFKENGEFVNNCIFTMMHHVGGDLQNVHTLFQPSILKTFSQIWETDYEICDDWSDLIEYVIHKFMNTSSAHCPENGNASETLHNELDDLEDVQNLLDSNNSHSDWTTEDKDNMLQYYSNSKEVTDTIAVLTDKYDLSETKHKTQISIIRELLEQGIITKAEYDDVIRTKDIDNFSDSANKHETIEKEERCDEKHFIDNDIKVLKEYLYKENKEKFVTWLQNVLIEACFVKLLLTCPDQFKEDDSHIVESTVYYYALLDLPIPVVPWTSEQANILKHQPFVMLLHKLGFYLPVDTGKVFVRIPNFWTADYMFSIAQQLGSIDPDIFKMSSTTNYTVMQNRLARIGAGSPCIGPEPMLGISRRQVNVALDNWASKELVNAWLERDDCSTTQLSIAIPEQAMLTTDIPPPRLSIATPTSSPRKTAEGVPLCAMPAEEADRMDCSPASPLLELLERASNCDTASVASDLTRMCVSDEEEKVTLLIAKPTAGDHQMA